MVLKVWRRRKMPKALAISTSGMIISSAAEPSARSGDHCSGWRASTVARVKVNMPLD
jgi:hypothetical protein